MSLMHKHYRVCYVKTLSALLVKNIIEGRSVLNQDALSNAEALGFYADLAELQQE